MLNYADLPDEIIYYVISSYLSTEDLYLNRNNNKRFRELFREECRKDFESNNGVDILIVALKYDNLSLSHKILDLQNQLRPRHREIFDTISSFLTQAFAAEAYNTIFWDQMLENPRNSLYNHIVENMIVPVFGTSKDKYTPKVREKFLSYFSKEGNYICRGTLDECLEISSGPSPYMKVPYDRRFPIDWYKLSSNLEDYTPFIRDIIRLSTKSIGNEDNFRRYGFYTLPEEILREILPLILDNPHFDYKRLSIRDLWYVHDILCRYQPKIEPEDLLPTLDYELEEDPAKYNKNVENILIKMAEDGKVDGDFFSLYNGENIPHEIISKMLPKIGSDVELERIVRYLIIWGKIGDVELERIVRYLVDRSKINTSIYINGLYLSLDKKDRLTPAIMDIFHKDICK